MNKKNIFIGVAWPYVNGKLHVGHLAGFLLPADIFARFHRYIGNNVLMISGSDCHGTPITVEAEKRGITPREAVKLYHSEHQKIFDLYGMTFDLYTKTTTENHKKVSQDLFVKLSQNGYITKAKSQQYFSVSENRFLPDRYVEGICPYCKKDGARGDQCDSCGHVLSVGELINPKSKLSSTYIILKETEHYYFNLPKLENFLKTYVNQNGPHWREWIFKETLGWFKTGLEARCITRDLDWGVKIPVEKLPEGLRIKDAINKTIYVWFEAVVGYLSASIEWAKDTNKWRKFWYPTKPTMHYYFMGKDNLVFHALFWPAQLYGAYKNIHLPDYLVISHFLDFEGRIFSKSRGTLVGAKEIAEKYGVDPIRFYLTAIMPETSDASFSWLGFVKTNNNILIANVGNFINRVLKLSQSLNNFSSEEIDIQVARKIAIRVEAARNKLLSCQFKAYLQEIVNLADLGNKYLNEKTPWNEGKESKSFKNIMTNALLIVLAINLISEPLIPETNHKLSRMLNIKIKTWPEKEVIKYLLRFLSKAKIISPGPLFKRIDPEVVEKEKLAI